MAVAYSSIQRRKILAIMLKWLIKLSRRGEKPVFVQNRQEFLSVWEIAHAWEGLELTASDAEPIPESIQAHIDTLMLAFLRDELPLRMSHGYRVLGNSFWAILFRLDEDYDRVADQVYRKKPLDRELPAGLYVRRSEFLHWCEKEFRSPPDLWATKSGVASQEVEPEEEPDESDGWLDQLTERRKKIVACLEFAKYLWRQDPARSYEDVFDHPILAQSGLRSVFSFESFKKWARPFAPEEVKRGGRRGKSET